VDLLSRREFLVGAGGFAAGLAVAGAGNLLTPATLAAEAVPAWPWPYAKLDPEAARKAGYYGYYDANCSYGAAKSLLGELSKVVGHPFNTIPPDLFRFGGGGGASWGTLCGALIGASGVVSLVTKDINKVLDEMYGWYCSEPFPSAKMDGFAKFKNQPTSVCDSPLCHVSVGEWCRVSGKRVGDAERKDRCAKLTGDVCAKTVELLNALTEGKLIAAFKPDEASASCLGCHVGAKSTLENTIGKTGCVSCHPNSHKK
jgi:hypothetical protein